MVEFKDLCKFPAATDHALINAWLEKDFRMYRNSFPEISAIYRA
jgi:hypothetical protein